MNEVNRIFPARDYQEKWAARALATLSADDGDHASVVNDAGFNKSDGDFGHSLASFLSRRGGLTSRQWKAAIKICRKYWRQVGECPPDPAPMQVISEIVHVVTSSFLPSTPDANRDQVELEAGEVSSRDREQAGTPVVDLRHFKPTGTPWIKPHDDGSRMTAEEWRDFDVRR